jgi:hypothetical protein
VVVGSIEDWKPAFIADFGIFNWSHRRKCRTIDFGRGDMGMERENAIEY